VLSRREEGSSQWCPPRLGAGERKESEIHSPTEGRKNMRCIPTDSAGITLGVDTHKDFHVAVALDGLGKRLGTLSIPTTPAGYEELVD
jgi:hypothetical protein